VDQFFSRNTNNIIFSNVL